MHIVIENHRQATIQKNCHVSTLADMVLIIYRSGFFYINGSRSFKVQGQIVTEKGKNKLYDQCKSVLWSVEADDGAKMRTIPQPFLGGKQSSE